MRNLKTEIEKVKKLGDEIGYGHLMSLASSLWRKKLKSDGIESGAFIPILKDFILKDKEIEKITNDDIKLYDKIIENYYNNKLI